MHNTIAFRSLLYSTKQTIVCGTIRHHVYPLPNWIVWGVVCPWPQDELLNGNYIKMRTCRVGCRYTSCLSSVLHNLWLDGNSINAYLQLQVLLNDKHFLWWSTYLAEAVGVPRALFIISASYFVTGHYKDAYLQFQIVIKWSIFPWWRTYYIKVLHLYFVSWLE